MEKALRALRSWFRADTKSPLRPPRVPRLRVELLEDRLAPAGDFRSVIGADLAQASYPYRGAGYSVAILDTGIDYNHPDLGGGFGPGKRVVAGWDFVNNDADPMDDNGHGTHLAGIVNAIAPDVRFISLKVLDSSMNGSWANVDSALQWVIAHKAEYNIVDVNLSLGSGSFTTNPYSLLETDFSTLRSMGVFTAVAAGNRYYTFNSQLGLAYPATSSNVVSVGATWADSYGSPVTFSTGASESNPVVDHLVSFTQRSSALSIVAPGAWITSTWKGGGYQPMGGTSMATAVVSGAAVILHQAYDLTGKSALASQDNLLRLMQATGNSVVDLEYGTDNVTNTGLTFKRVNLKAALDTIGAPNAAPTVNAVADRTMQAYQTITVALTASDADGDPITFSSKQIFLPGQAYLLDQQFAFTYLGNYYTNLHGANEKWMLGASNQWYCVLASGEVRRWAGSMPDTMLPGSLVGTFDSSFYADPSKLWNAPYAGMPPAVFSISGNKLSIRSPAYWVGTYGVDVTASDGHYSVVRRFNVTVTPANATPILAPIADQTMPHSKRTLILALSATDADRDPIAFSARVLPTAGTTPAVSLSIQGNQLTISPAVNVVGTFTIQVTASDGKATDSKTFAVTVTNGGPTINAIPNQVMAKSQTSLTLTLPAADPDGDVLTMQAATQTPDAAVYVLNQQYGFRASSAAYYQNLVGQNEKWLIDKNNRWYILLPTGQLYRWAQSVAQTLTVLNQIATFDAKIWSEPRLLWEAQPALAPSLAFSFNGNQLTIQRPATLTGVFFIDVTVSDGVLTAKRTFQITLN